MNKNIFLLIGMPGCGKTTIGKILSKRLQIKFCDIDKYIEKNSRKSIPEIFEMGEETFRNYETLACKKLSRIKKLTIISSGGGIVKREENIEFFRKKSIIIFIDRPIANIIGDIDDTNRPLLKENITRLYDLHTARYNLYKKYADYTIINNKKIKDIIDEIENLISVYLKKQNSWEDL